MDLTSGTTNPVQTPVPTGNKRMKLWLAICAGVLVVLGVGAYFILQKPALYQGNIGLISPGAESQPAISEQPAIGGTIDGLPQEGGGGESPVPLGDGQEQIGQETPMPAGDSENISPKPASPNPTPGARDLLGGEVPISPKPNPETPNSDVPGSPSPLPRGGRIGYGIEVPVAIGEQDSNENPQNTPNATLPESCQGEKGWNCSAWSNCKDSVQTRVCTPKGECPGAPMPWLEQLCSATATAADNSQQDKIDELNKKIAALTETAAKSQIDELNKKIAALTETAAKSQSGVVAEIKCSDPTFTYDPVKKVCVPPVAITKTYGASDNGKGGAKDTNNKNANVNSWELTQDQILAAQNKQSNNAKAPTNAAATGEVKTLHGAYIAGKTGPEILLYPVLVSVANGLYYMFRKRKRNIK